MQAEKSSSVHFFGATSLTKKKGQKRMQGHREPNGRLSRRRVHVREREEMTQREAQSVAIAARMRHTGLPEEVVSLNHAGRPNAGTVHGIMCLRGDISRAQWDAAEWWIGKRIAVLRAIEPPAQRTGEAGGGTFDEDRYAEWCRSARETWAAVLDCIQEASTETRSPLMAALDVILWRGEYAGHLVGDLRIALNAIHRRFLSA